MRALPPDRLARPLLYPALSWQPDNWENRMLIGGKHGRPRRACPFGETGRRYGPRTRPAPPDLGAALISRRVPWPAWRLRDRLATRGQRIRGHTLSGRVAASSSYQMLQMLSRIHRAR